MRTPSKLLVGVALAALAVAGGAAFTAPGLATTAGATQFVGGQVNQSVTGAELTRIDYSYSTDADHHLINGITLTFKDALVAGAAVTAIPTATPATEIPFVIDGTDPLVWHSTSSNLGLTGLTNLAVSVAGVNPGVVQTTPAG